MLLAADLRNSHGVLALVDGDTLRSHWRVSTDRARTADEWALLVRGLLATEGTAGPLSGIAVAATVPATVQEWRELSSREFAELPLVVVEPGMRTGLPMLADNPREIGADRICNAVAAAHLFPGPCVVVDFSDATTFDVVSADGRYLGGAITPGLEMSLSALREGSAQLREVEMTRPRSVIGRNTVEALQSGLVFGVAAQVEGMVERIRHQLGDPEALAVVATGHEAPLVVAESHCFTEHAPLLTVRGLALVHARNR